MATKRLRCNRCGKKLYGAKSYYLVRARVTSEPTELSFSEEELSEDHDAELRRLAEETSGRDAEALEEEVFVDLDYFLCVSCKKAYVKEVRKGPE
ncbi:MAG: hypothetical protein WC728_13435 [Elusimicrobiota bacterium]